MKTFTVLSALAVLAAATPSLAQSLPACAGAYQNIRVDVIKPGKLDLFLKAVKDNQAWYTAHGVADTVQVGRVIERGASSFSTSAALTVHTYAAPPAAERNHDAAWDAFVAEYKESSDITNQWIACVAAVK